MSAVADDFEKHWRAFASQLAGFLRTRVSSAEDAEDLRQEIFLRLHRELESKRKINNTRAWLFRTARNALVDYYRKRRTNEPLDEQISDVLANEMHTEVNGLEPLNRSLRNMIELLPETYREAVLLADFEELPHKQVAKILGIGLPATKSRILRGKAKLRLKIKECCDLKQDNRGSIIQCEPRKDQCCDQCL